MPQGAAQHSTGQSPRTIPSFSACIRTCTEATVLSTRLTSCKPYVLRKRTSQINFVVVRTYICTLYFCQVLCCLCFYIVLTFGVIRINNSNYYKIYSYIVFYILS